MMNLDWATIHAVADRLGVPYETSKKWRQRRIPPAWRAALLAVLNDGKRSRRYSDAHLPQGAQEVKKCT